jgi:colanic acid/amylovoran biosynthesis protein
MPTNILIINVHSSCNAGDAALTLTAIQQLRENFPQSRLTVVMDDPDSTLRDVYVVDSFFHWVKGTGRDEPSNWRIGNLLLLIPASILPVLTFRLFGRAVFILTPAPLRRLIQSYLEADLVVSKPGGFLYSSGLGLTMLITVYTFLLAVWAGKPLYVFPQSIGPLTRWWEHLLLRWVLSKPRIVMVREAGSLQQLRTWGLTSPHCSWLPDMAFSFAGAPTTSAEEWLASRGIRRNGPLLGLSAIDWGAQNPRFGLQVTYEAACADVARSFIRQYSGKVIVFAHSWGPAASQDDRAVARRIVAQLSDLSDSVLLVDWPVAPDLLKAIYGQMDVFVATRTHAAIFALSAGVPTLLIGYQHKAWGIARMLDLESWVVDIQQIGSQVLIDRLAALWTERDAVRNQIQQRLPALLEQARQPGALIAADFRKLREESRRD